MKLKRSWIALLSLLLVHPLLQAAEPPAATAPPHSAITPEPRDANWRLRHESINGRASQGHVDLIFLGDSITQGWTGNGTLAWQKYYGNRKAMNAGIGGDRTQHVLWRLDNGNIEGLSPKLVVLMIGTNNSRDNTAQEIAEGVAAIVAKLRAKLPETKVLVLGIFPRGANDKDPRRQVNQEANEQIKLLADDEHVFYLDIGDKFLSEDGKLTEEIMPDLLHLSPQGYQIWAESIEPSVARLMGESGT